VRRLWDRGMLERSKKDECEVFFGFHKTLAQNRTALWVGGTHTGNEQAVGSIQANLEHFSGEASGTDEVG